MSQAKRILNILWSLFTLLCSALLVVLGRTGYSLVILLLAATGILAGIRQLFYYFTMAIYMVGGKRALFRGIILLDFGIFTLMLTNVPTYYVMIYLLSGFLFSGVVDLLRARENKRNEAPWKLIFSLGVIEAAAGAGCLFFLKNPAAVVYIYSGVLAYSAVVRLISVFRKSAITYIG